MTKIAPRPMRLLVIQFRNDITLQHERDCLERFIAAEHAHYTIEFVSYFDEPHRLLDVDALLDGVDRVILGGSAGLYLADGHDEQLITLSHQAKDAIAPIIPEIIRRAIPLLGICFGHQLIALHYGASVVFDPSQAETGFVEITLEHHAEDNDILTQNIPHKFFSVMGHQDSVIDVPSEATVLAHSDKCGVEIVRYESRMVWGIQFHPELTSEDFVYRLGLFPEYAEYAETLHIEPAPHARQILSHFLQLDSTMS